VNKSTTNTIFLSLVLTALGGLGYKNLELSKTPEPAPAIVPADNTPPVKPIDIPVNPPEPKTIVEPVTPVTPVAEAIDPVAAITITDSRGNPIVDKVDHSKMIIVSSEKSVHGSGPASIAWDISPPMEMHVVPGLSEMVVITPATDAVLTFYQMVALNDKVSWQKISIKCGLGNVPPPAPPGPPVPPTPDPDPITKVRKTFSAVVVDYKNIPVDAKIVMNAIGVWNESRNDGSDYRFYNSPDGNGEVKGKRAVADVLKANVALPALVTYSLDGGELIDVIPLPISLDESKPESLQSAMRKRKNISN